MLLSLVVAEGSAQGIAAPEEFDPRLESSITAPAKFVLEPVLEDASPLAPSGTADGAPEHLTQLSSGTSAAQVLQRAPDPEDTTDWLLDSAPIELDSTEVVTSTFSLDPRSSVLDHTAALDGGVSLVSLPLHQRLMLSGRSWQRELTPGGLRSTMFGAEAKVGLSERVDFRMGLELLQTGPGSYGLDSGQSDDSLYAQFKFKF